MTAEQFRELLGKPLWSKEVILWVGTEAALRSILAGLTRMELDLRDLLPADDDLPEDDAERADLVSNGLDRWLDAAKARIDSRTVLLVSGVPLLARYRVGLRPFYDWFGGSRTAVVLHVDPVARMRLPDSVSTSIVCDTNRIVDYLRPLLVHPDKCVMETA